MSQWTFEDDRWRGPTPKAAAGVGPIPPGQVEEGQDEDMVDTSAAVAATVAVSSGRLRLARSLSCPIRRFLEALAAPMLEMNGIDSCYYEILPNCFELDGPKN